jgi:hypothetical protein
MPAYLTIKRALPHTALELDSKKPGPSEETPG